VAPPRNRQARNGTRHWMMPPGDLPRRFLSRDWSPPSAVLKRSASPATDARRTSCHAANRTIFSFSF
jgi:hypothetical protein